MATGGAPRRDGPMALSKPVRRCAAEPGERAKARHRPATVSCTAAIAMRRARALFLDRRLTPLERNAWRVFRFQLNDDGVTAFPTYDQLRPYLASMPCGAQASHTKQIARALTLLRLTRLAQPGAPPARPKTGRILGNLYVPTTNRVTPSRRCSSIPTTWAWWSDAHPCRQGGADRRRMHAEAIAEDPLLSGRTLPTRLRSAGAAHGPAWLGDADYPGGR